MLSLSSIYIESILSRTIGLKITDVGKNLSDNLQTKIHYEVEGKCIGEGFIKPKSVHIVSYSGGLVKGDRVEFQVIYKCLVCNPVKDMEVECAVNNVTKAGIHAHVIDEADNYPITIFVAKDHHQSNTPFESIVNKDIIRVKIIGSRFELNDTSITSIASFIDKI